MPSGDESDTQSDTDEESCAFNSPERKLALWFGVIFGANIICVLLLAARSSSASPVRGWLDVGIFSCVSGVAALGISRLLFLYPFRLLDLFVMITTLALGMKGAIELARVIRRSSVTGVSEIPEDQLIAVACLLTGCVLMAGATVGLRNCRSMSIESPAKRALVLVSGMMWLPAPMGMLVLPFQLLSNLLKNKTTTPGDLVWIVALLGCVVCTSANFYFSIISSSLKTQNSNSKSWPQSK